MTSFLAARGVQLMIVSLARCNNVFSKRPMNSIAEEAKAGNGKVGSLGQ